MAEDIKQLLVEQENRINKHTDEKTEEAKRHFDVVAENLGKNIVGAMKEELQTHGQRLDRVESKMEKIDKDLTYVKDDVAAIKVTFESVNPLGLKQEVVDVQRRVTILESKGE